MAPHVELFGQTLPRFLLALLLAWPLAVLAEAADAPPEPVATRQSAFVIPFQIEAGDGGPGDPAEVELHVSLDGGRTWRKHARLPATERRFRFRAMADGEYCFALRTWDRQGVVRPAGPFKVELRVLVDTAPPELELSAERDPAGEIAVRLRLSDANLRPESLKLEYRPQGSTVPWQQVEFDPLPSEAGGAPHEGQIWFVPSTSARNLDLRAEVRDLAGNPAVTSFVVAEREQVPLEDGTVAPRLAPPRTQQVVGSDDWRPRQPTPWPADATADSPLNAPRRAGRPVAPPVARTAAEDGRVEPLDDESATAAATTAPERGTGRSERSAIPVHRAGLAERAPLAADRDEQASEGAYRDETGREPAATAATLRDVPAGVRPRMVNSTHFRLDYDVEAVGPWGVRKVELWGTRDAGRSWELYGTDDDNQSPLVVVVPEEGMYGFRVLVQSGSGLVEPPPRGGEPPEIWLGVDLTPPSGRIAAVETGSGERAGQLIVHWEADDALPGERPISLFYSERADGPWTPITTGLRNSGRYVWQLDQTVPERVFLRLEVRDEAGNATDYDAPEAVTVAPLRPRGRILNVEPVEETRVQPRVYRF